MAVSPPPRRTGVGPAATERERLDPAPPARTEPVRWPAPGSRADRPHVRGKFLYVADEKCHVRGVTYGTFPLLGNGGEAHDPAVVARDFAAMAAHGINAVRVYTVPPRWLLDAAFRNGLRVMVGLPWEQHVAFLDDAERAESIVRRVCAGVRACAGHPAVLCYAIGNEIPAPIVRWHGRRRVERFLERLYHAAKAVDPGGLITYVNYPSTEYLRLPFLDVVCFNVYLESRERLEAYLARLHNLAADRPLIMGEVGLDSRRNGEESQARVLDWQIRAAFASGCAGAFVFAWTDEWHRGGYEIDDWDFGLTTRDRCPKPALTAVADAFAQVPFAPHVRWPRISVVVCSYNGQRTLRECLEGVSRLDYPEYEVLVVDDGSTTDAVATIAAQYGVRLIRTENRGLSSARNTGLQAASGEIVAYLDDDAWPDPHWLKYLASSFLSTDFVGVGGPNIPPGSDGLVADCVANAPGGPIHVLLSDRDAEHIPGCNMAFRASALKAVGGFDPAFHIAGDDVDLCWRLQQRGWTLGFHPAAVVWHHRRSSVRAYLRQQRGYGRAEALLERKWPEKYNAVGHVPWAGRIYASYLTRLVGTRGGRVYHGTWGSAPFQSLYQPAPSSLRALLAMPEAYVVLPALAVIGAMGRMWAPLFLALPILAAAAGAVVAHAAASAAGATFPSAPRSRGARLGRYALTTLLHLLQPVARLAGRLGAGLTPWRRGAPGLALPRTRVATVWSERWESHDARLRTIEAALRTERVVTLRGGDYDAWDLEVRGGMLGGVRVLAAVEEHGGGRQLMRVRTWPTCSRGVLRTWLVFVAVAAAAALDGAAAAALILVAVAAGLAMRAAYECSRAMAAIVQTIEQLQRARTVVEENRRLADLVVVGEVAREAPPRGASAPAEPRRTPLTDASLHRPVDREVGL